MQKLKNYKYSHTKEEILKKRKNDSHRKEETVSKEDAWRKEEPRRKGRGGEVTELIIINCC